MVMTEEELDYLAFLEVRAEAKGEARGESKGQTNAISVFEKLGVSPETIAQAKAILAAKNSKT